MILNKSIRRAIAVFMLFCFSAAAFPIDFLHNHSTETTCADILKHSTCTHKLHISKKAADCFACNAHFDKNFPLNYSKEIFISLTNTELNTVSCVECKLNCRYSYHLRGPPAA